MSVSAESGKIRESEVFQTVPRETHSGNFYMSTSDQRGRDISLLDILVVMSENFWLLLLCPLVVGAFVFMMTPSALPRFESSAVLKPLNSSEFMEAPDSLLMMEFAIAEKRLQSPDLTEEAFQKVPWIKRSEPGASEPYVAVERDEQGNLLTVAASASTAEQAEQLADAYVRSYADSDNLNIDQLLVQRPSNGTLVAPGHERMIAAIRAAFLAGIAILFYVLVRAAVRSASERPESAAKLVRIRKGLLRR